MTDEEVGELWKALMDDADQSLSLVRFNLALIDKLVEERTERNIIECLRRQHHPAWAACTHGADHEAEARRDFGLPPKADQPQAEPEK